MKEVSLTQLFGHFFRLGATAYGGPAMTAYLRQEALGRHGWVSEQEFKDGMAFCHTIPGATTMQMATYLGYRLRGMPGATVAAVAFVLPGFLSMTGLSAAYFAFGELRLVQTVSRGLAAVAAVVAIILNACVTLARPILTTWQAVPIVALAFAALLFGANTIVVLLGAGLLAVLVLRTPPPNTEPRQ